MRGRVQESARLFELIERVRAAAESIPDVDILGDPEFRLPNTVTFSCLYADGERLARLFDALERQRYGRAEAKRPDRALTRAVVAQARQLRVALRAAR